MNHAKLILAIVQKLTGLYGYRITVCKCDVQCVFM